MSEAKNGGSSGPPGPTNAGPSGFRPPGPSSAGISGIRPTGPTSAGETVTLPPLTQGKAGESGSLPPLSQGKLGENGNLQGKSGSILLAQADSLPKPSLATAHLTQEESSLPQQVVDFLAKNPRIMQSWLEEEDGKELLGKLGARKKSQGELSSSREGREGREGEVMRKRRVSVTADLFNQWLETPPTAAGAQSRPGSNTAQHRTHPVDDRNERLLDLILDISTELDINVLTHKILLNVGQLTDADRCSLFLARGPRDNRWLEAKLFDVTADTSLEDAMNKAAKENIKIEWGQGIAGTVASTKKYINISNAYQDPRFNPSIDEKTGYTTASLVCLPVTNYQGELIGVAQIVNKKSGAAFTQSDVQVFEKYLSFCGVGLQNAQLFEVSILEYKKNQLLLSLARSLFQEQMSLDRLITTIITEAKEMLKCERCTVYLLDLKMYDSSQNEPWFLQQMSGPLSPALVVSPGSQASSLPGSTNKFFGDKEVDSSSLKEGSLAEDITFDVAYETGIDNGIKVYNHLGLTQSKRIEIAKHVACTTEVLNLSSVASWLGDEGGEGGLVEEDGFQPKCMLSLPIFNDQRTVVGVAQLINKWSHQEFDEKDIGMFEAFAIFCGIGIHNTKMYESACKLMAKQRVALDCLSYHATASETDMAWLSKESIPSAKNFQLYSYKFNDLEYSDSQTLKIVIRMFMDFDLLSIFQIPYPVLCRWALSVKKNYRPVKYHNWRHALNVCQTMFTVLKTGKMDRFMSDLEVLGLLVACLSHDLDHRGTNNAYQSKVESPLAVLYSTSTMEHHHFDQCVMILSSDGNNLFQGMTTDEYRAVMGVVEMAILSTDLASYFHKKERFLETADKGEIDWQESEKKDLLCGMLMTACDVAAIAKPWEIQHNLAKLVADEFFDQGDMEKLKLNITPIAMMDRERKDELPQMQVEFIDVICIPLYSTLSESFPWMRPLLEGCMSNREKWIDLAEKVMMGLTWIDHDTIENPVEEVKEGTAVAEDLELTIETLKPKVDERKDSGVSLIKKRSFRSMRNPVRPPVGFFNRRLSTRSHTPKNYSSTTSVASSADEDSSAHRNKVRSTHSLDDHHTDQPGITVTKVMEALSKVDDRDDTTLNKVGAKTTLDE